jgi:hypothetical protein
LTFIAVMVMQVVPAQHPGQLPFFWQTHWPPTQSCPEAQG